VGGATSQTPKEKTKQGKISGVKGEEGGGGGGKGGKKKE